MIRWLIFTVCMISALALVLMSPLTLEGGDLLILAAVFLIMGLAVVVLRDKEPYLGEQPCDENTRECETPRRELYDAQPVKQRAAKEGGPDGINAVKLACVIIVVGAGVLALGLLLHIGGVGASEPMRVIESVISPHGDKVAHIIEDRRRGKSAPAAYNVTVATPGADFTLFGNAYSGLVHGVEVIWTAPRALLIRTTFTEGRSVHVKTLDEIDGVQVRVEEISH